MPVALQMLLLATARRERGRIEITTSRSTSDGLGKRAVLGADLASDEPWTCDYVDRQGATDAS